MQTKPIRSATGADITQATLQQTLQGLNIDTYVGDLSYAEKRLLIIISLTQQLSEATDDFGRTIESPANQMRILSEQWERLSRSVGNVFMPILAKVLPYLNAIVMTLTEIINIIAGLLGFKLEDFDYFGGVADSVLDLEDGLNGASESAKKLKQGLRGFDKLNVITTPTKSSSSSGAGGGIDPKIMEAFNNAFDEYNSKLTDVTMKATKIRDSIMEWLGFTKQTDLITGKVSFKYEGIKKTLSNVYNWFKKLNPQAKILVGLFAVLVTKNTIKMITNLIKLLGKTGVYKWIVALISPTTQMLKQVKEYIKYSPTLSSGIKTAINDWQIQLTTMDKVKNSFSSLIIAGAGLLSIKTSMDSINESGLNLFNTLGLLGGSLGTVLGGIQLGATLGGSTGAIIGGVAGAVVSLVTAIISYEDETDKLVKKTEENYNAHKKYNDELRNTKKIIEENLITGLAQQQYYQNLVDELKTLVDENGNVKKGYEDRVEFIVNQLNSAYGLELKITNGQIEGYKEQIKTIQELIETKKAEIMLKANEEAYTLAIKNQAEAWKRAQNSKDEYNKSNEKGLQLMDELAKAESLIGTSEFKNFKYRDEKGNEYKGWNAYKQLKKDAEAYTKVVENNWKTYQEDKALYEEYTDDIVKYETLSTAILTGKKEEIKKALESYTHTVVIEGEKQKLSQAELLKFYKSNGDETISYLKSQGVEITEETKNTAYANYQTLLNSLIDQTNTIKEMTPEIGQSWGTLAETSKDDFLSAFEKLQPEIRHKVTDQMESEGYKISEELQKGINKIDPTFVVKTDLTEANKTVKIDADTTQATQKTQTLWDNLRNAFNLSIFKNFGTIPFFKFASGGLPPVGQLFVANENGPELVSQIGGQTFVANQNQMMDLLDKKIGNAQSKKPQIFNIYLDANHKIGTYTLEQLEDIAKDNGKPITIGG